MSSTEQDHVGSFRRPNIIPSASSSLTASRTARLATSSSGETYAQIAARHLGQSSNGASSSSMANVTANANAEPHPRSEHWLAEDIDRAEHLDQLSLYEGIMEGHNWPVAPLPAAEGSRPRPRARTPSRPQRSAGNGNRNVISYSSRSGETIGYIDDDDAPLIDEGAGGGGEREVGMAPMITLEDILEGPDREGEMTAPSISTSATALRPTTIPPPTDRLGQPSSSRRARLITPSAWPSDPIAGDIRRIFGDLASIPDPARLGAGAGTGTDAGGARDSTINRESTNEVPESGSSSISVNPRWPDPALYDSLRNSSTSTQPRIRPSSSSTSTSRLPLTGPGVMAVPSPRDRDRNPDRATSALSQSNTNINNRPNRQDLPFSFETALLDVDLRPTLPTPIPNSSGIPHSPEPDTTRTLQRRTQMMRLREANGGVLPRSTILMDASPSDLARRWDLEFEAAGGVLEAPEAREVPGVPEEGMTENSDMYMGIEYEPDEPVRTDMEVEVEQVEPPSRYMGQREGEQPREGEREGEGEESEVAPWWRIYTHPNEQLPDRHLVRLPSPRPAEVLRLVQAIPGQGPGPADPSSIAGPAQPAAVTPVAPAPAPAPVPGAVDPRWFGPEIMRQQRQRLIDASNGPSARAGAGAGAGVGAGVGAGAGGDRRASLTRGGNNRRRGPPFADTGTVGGDRAETGAGSRGIFRELLDRQERLGSAPPSAASSGESRRIVRLRVPAGASRGGSGMEPTNTDTSDGASARLVRTSINTEGLQDDDEAAGSSAGKDKETIEAEGRRMNSKTSSARARSDSNSSISATDHPLKRRKLGSGSRDNTSSSRLNDQVADATGTEIGPTRPEYLKYSSLPTSTILPSTFLPPARTSHLALTTHRPSPSLSPPSSSLLQPAHPQPCISFTLHPLPTRTDSDACSLRTTHPIPPGVGLYYYEIEVLDSGPEGYMSLGWMRGDMAGMNMRRLVGWEKGSWGWHADDGRCFEESGSGREFGPTWGIGDIIGAGIDYTTRRAFFTKNGKLLGHTFKNLPPNLHPAVGLRNPRESVAVNFTGPFTYNINEHVQKIYEGVVEPIRSMAVKSVFRLDVSPVGQARMQRDRSSHGSGISDEIGTVVIQETILAGRQRPAGMDFDGDRRAASTAAAAVPVIERPIKADISPTSKGPVNSSAGMSVTTQTQSATVEESTNLLLGKRKLAIQSDSPLHDPMTKCVTSLVLDYMNHLGLDRVKGLMIRDLARRKMVTPATSTTRDEISSIDISTEGEVGQMTPASSSCNHRIITLAKTVRDGARVPWVEIARLLSRSEETGRQEEDMNVDMDNGTLPESLRRKLRILHLVAMLQPADLIAEIPLKIPHTSAEIVDQDQDMSNMPDDTAMLEGRRLFAAARAEQWTAEENQWLNEAFGLLSLTKACLSDGGGDIWKSRREECSEELIKVLRERQGLRPRSLLEQTILQNRANIAKLIGVGDGAAAFVDPDGYMRTAGKSHVV